MASPAATEEMRLERAAHTLQAVFLMFREATWHNHVLDINAESKNIVIEDDPEKTTRRQGWFSDCSKVRTLKPEDKAAVLTMMSIGDVGNMKQLIGQMLEGMDVVLEDVMLRIQSPQRTTLILYGEKVVDFNDYEHWLIRVTSRTSRKQWAIDIAGAQYGHHVYFAPWQVVLDNFIERILLVKPFGTQEQLIKAVGELKSVAGMEADVQAKAMEAFHATVDPKMQKKGHTWASILEKDEKDFVRHRDRVLKVGRSALDKYVEATHLTKRRLKMERFENRHPDVVEADKNRVCDDILGFRPSRTDVEVGRVIWRMSTKEEPPSEQALA